MRRIAKSSPPNSFTTYALTQGATFADIPSKIKDDLKESLLNEQGWICGYCQQVINDKSRAAIEHHCEQSICNGQNNTQDRRLDYTNLLAVCFGNAGHWDMHCDAKKSQFTTKSGLPIKISPWSVAHIAKIIYHSTGLITSSDSTHSNEISKILNLNAKYLKSSRKEKFIRFYSLSTSNKVVLKDKLKRLLLKDMELSGNKFSNSFPGLSEFMFKRYNF